MRARRTLAISILLGLLVGGIAAAIVIRILPSAPSAADAFGLNEVAANGNVQGALYPGDAVAEARLVESEDERLVYIRTVSSVARWSDASPTGPYRLATGDGYTLVLPARAMPYTASDLLELAPDTFTRASDGAYLLSESIAVLAGATLSLVRTEPMELRLASGDHFVSIVTLGGSLVVAGTVESPVAITSWDVRSNAPDRDTSDGRAYLRVIGGTASLSHVDLSHLGFWSGNTGGFALTGTHAESAASVATRVADQSHRSEVAGAPIIPPRQLETLALSAEDDNYVSAEISDLRVEGNAFGIFVTSADGVAIANTQITDSLVDGLAFHRYVTNSSVTNVTSTGNAVDGVSLARSSTGVVFDGVTASRNGRNGISLDSQSLADGPSAIGTAVELYGDNVVKNSVFIANGRYGVEVSGGENTFISANTIESNQMGVVVNHGAVGVRVVANSFSDQARQSIALRDGVMSAQVSDNMIVAGDTGIYLRNAAALVTHNTMDAISNHGVTIVGEADAVTVRENTIAGTGSIAIFDQNSEGALLQGNDLQEWHPAPTIDSVTSSVFQPLTMIWIALGLLLLATALIPRGRTPGVFQHPYAERVPLSALTKGIASVDSLGRTQ